MKRIKDNEYIESILDNETEDYFEENTIVEEFLKNDKFIESIYRKMDKEQEYE